MKLGKTAQRLLDEARTSPLGRAGYGGDREANAVHKLVKLGLVKRFPVDGSYWRRKRNGDYVREYCPQGRIEII